MRSDDIEAVYRRTKSSLVLRGLLGVAVGVFVLVRPLESVATFALVIAFWALADGLSGIVHAFDLSSVWRYWWVSALGGLVSALFGIVALVSYPTLSLGFTLVWIALWLITGGALGLSVAARERRLGMQWEWTLSLALLAIVAGILTVTYPGLTLAVLLDVIGGYALVGGIVRLVTAARLRAPAPRADRAVGSPARA